MDMNPYYLREGTYVAALGSATLDIEGGQPISSAMQGSDGSSEQYPLIASHEYLRPPPSPPSEAFSPSRAATRQQANEAPPRAAVPCRLPPAHRTLLVGWMREVTGSLRLHLTTLFTATDLLDRFVAAMQVLPPDSMLQLLALTCMSVAVKYNEAQPVSASEWLNLAVQPGGSRLYEPEDLARFEQLLFETLGPDIQKPTALSVLRQMLPVCCPCNQEQPQTQHQPHNTTFGALGAEGNIAIPVPDYGEMVGGEVAGGGYRAGIEYDNTRGMGGGGGGGGGFYGAGEPMHSSSAAVGGGGSPYWRHTNEVEAPLLGTSEGPARGFGAEERGTCGCPFARLAESLMEMTLPYDAFGLYSPTTCALACLTVAERLDSREGSLQREGDGGTVGESSPGWRATYTSGGTEARPATQAAAAVTAAVRFGVPEELSMPGLQACVEAVRTCYMNMRRQRT